MLRGRVYVGTAEAVALGSAHPSCLPAGLFLHGADRAASSAAGWAVTPAAPARLACPRRARGPAEAGRGGLPGRVCYFLWSMQTAACGFWFGFLFSSSLPSSACANKPGPLPRLWRSTGTRQAALILANPSGALGIAGSILAALHPPHPRLGGGMGPCAGRWAKHSWRGMGCKRLGPKGTDPSSLSCSLTQLEGLCNFSIPWRWSEEGADGQQRRKGAPL